MLFFSANDLMPNNIVSFYILFSLCEIIESNFTLSNFLEQLKVLHSFSEQFGLKDNFNFLIRQD